MGSCVEAECGLQGMLSSTGQVQCGQVHCRLPYTAPPVHLKADMDGPLSNRGEKVNGARLGLVGRSLCWVVGSIPRHRAGTILLCGRPPLPDVLRPPLCPRGSDSSRCQCVLCARALRRPPGDGWPSLCQICGFSDLAQAQWFQRARITQLSASHHLTGPSHFLLSIPVSWECGS